MQNRNIIVTMQCYIHKDGKYLMLHRRPDKRLMPDVWMAPGGKLEFKEGLYNGARREIEEETGLQIKNIRLKAIGNGYLEDLGQELYFHMLVAEYADGEVTQNPADGELVWLTKEEILKLENLLAELKHVIPHILSDDTNVISYTASYDTGNHMTSFKLERQ